VTRTRLLGNNFVHSSSSTKGQPVGVPVASSTLKIRRFVSVCALPGFVSARRRKARDASNK